MKKRSIAFLIVLCLVIGLMPVTAMAGGEDEVTTYQQMVAAIAEMEAQGKQGYVRVNPAEDFGFSVELAEVVYWGLCDRCQAAAAGCQGAGDAKLLSARGGDLPEPQPLCGQTELLLVPPAAL